LDKKDEQAWQAVRLPFGPGPKERLEAILEEQRQAAPPEENFAELLESGGYTRPFARLEPGDKVSGRVVSLDGPNVLVDVGQRSEGWIPREEFRPEELERLRIGDTIEAYVVRGTGAPRLSRAMLARSLDLQTLVEASRTGVPVEGKVSGQNKGGYTVDLPGARGFVPFSQMDLGTRLPPSDHIGKVYRFRVMEVRGRDVVLSRAALLKEEAKAKMAEVLSTIEEGQVMRVPVVKVESFGLFVDLGGGLHGLVPRSEISFSRSEDVKFAVGDQVTVKLIHVERGGERPRVTASIKAAQDDPWGDVPERFPVGAIVRGKVTRLAPYGAFVEVAPGVEALLHVSEISAAREVRSPGEVLRQGQEVTCAITAVDAAARRMSVSIKAAEAMANEPDAALKARYMARASDGSEETAMGIAIRRLLEKRSKNE